MESASRVPVKVVRIKGEPLTVVELSDGSKEAVGAVLHLPDAKADALVEAGKAEEVPWHFTAIKITAWGSLGYGVGQVVEVAWSPIEPDVRTTQDLELQEVAYKWWRVRQERQEGLTESEFRDYLRESDRLGIYAEFEQLPEWLPSAKTGGPISIAVALALVEDGFAEPVHTEDAEEFRRWLERVKPEDFRTGASGGAADATPG